MSRWWQDAATGEGRKPDAKRAGLFGFLLGAAGVFTQMYSTQAILPELGRAFDVGPAQAGLTISVVVIAVAFGAWAWGPLSDHWGRRRCLVLASALLVGPTAAVGLAPSFGLLLLLRGLQGLCMPGLLVVGPIYVVEAFGTLLGGRAMGYYVSTLVAGGLVARVGVALLSDLVGWRWALGSLALLPCVATVLMQRTLPDVPPPQTPDERGPAAISRQLHNRRLLRATAGGCALFFSFVGTFSFVAYRLEGPPFDLTPTATGLVFLLWVVGAVGPATGDLADRVGWRAVLICALTVDAGALALSLPDTLPTLILALMLMTTVMFAGSTAATLGVATASEANRGLASAIYFSCYYLSAALAGFLPGLAWQLLGWPGVAGSGLLAVGAAVAVLTVALPEA